MTDLRDKIHQVVRGNLPATSRADMHANDVTDAIIAALPGMVAPLVWVETRHKLPDQLGVRSSAIGINYVIISALMRDNCILSSDGSVCIGPFCFDTLGEAKAAANAHHAAAVVGAFKGSKQ